MRVFVIGTGRTGSLTLARALEDTVTNFTVGHETQAREPFDDRSYPDQHIETDHRLSFYMGRLMDRYGEEPLRFVELTRDFEETVASWARRMRIKGGMMPAWGNGILFRTGNRPALEVARDYVRAVRSNVDWMHYLVQSWPPGEIRFAADVNLAYSDSLGRMWDELELEGDRDRFLELCRRRLNRSRRYV